MAILTVSRQFGSGGREIGRTVSHELGYRYIDRTRILEDIRQAGGQWEKWSETLDEHRPTVWERYDWSFRGFAALIQNVILQEALKNNVVIMGRGGNFLLKDIPYALRIRVVAPMDKRIDRIMARESVDRDSARWLSERTDRERSGLIHLLFGKHWDDPTEYDIVFDTGIKTLDEIATLVTDALLEKEKYNTEAARKLLYRKARAAEIKAELLTDHGLFIPILDVYPEGEYLILRGVTHSPEEHRKVEEKAKRIAGDIPLKCELHYRG
jgi:cytidylate kinase